jgi:aspartate/methionine/tyrosine aminotransferase
MKSHQRFLVLAVLFSLSMLTIVDRVAVSASKVDMSRELASSLLDEVGVAVLPGQSFGPEGAGHIRLSYAASIANLEEAARRIAQYVGAAVPG